MKKSGFLEGAFIATLCIVISKVLGVLYVIPFYQIIGEGGGTLYGYAYNIYNVFLIVSSAGIPLAISKLTSEYHTLGMEDEKARMYRLATRIILSFSVFAFLICFLFAPALSRLIIGELEGGNTEEDVTFVIRLISFALLVVPFLSIKRGYLQGHRYMKEPSFSQVIEQLVRIGVILGGSFILSSLLHLPVRWAVGISVFAATIGALASYFYLNRCVNQNRSLMGLDRTPTATREGDKAILKKIVWYSIPFVIINLANTLYNSTDMILVIRTLPKLGFSAKDTEFVSSVFTTWGVKFNTIVTSVSTGLIVSLIPNMVKDYTERNMDRVNSNFNKCLKIILLIIAPLAIFMSGMSESVWNVFYGKSDFGPSIIAYSLLVTILDCLYMVTNSLLQSLNQPKIIYSGVISGLLTNLILDIPLMHLFHRLGLPAYYGAITATLFGFVVSCSLSMIYLRKKMGFRYSETGKIIPRFLLSALLLAGLLFVFRSVFPTESQNKFLQIGILLVSALVCGAVWVALNYRSILDVLPEKLKKSKNRIAK